MGSRRMETVSKLDVCCLKLGSAYIADNVNKLFRDVERTTHINDFICFTEESSGLNSNITVRELPGPKMDDRMWWNKVYLLGGDVFENETIYLDLDVIIHSSLIGLPEGQIIETSWFSEPMSKVIHSCNINSSVMRFKDNNFSTMYCDWLANWEKLYKSFYGLDMWFYRRHKILQSRFFKRGHIYSYKFGSIYPNDIVQNEFRSNHVVCILDDVENKQEVLNVSSKF